MEGQKANSSADLFQRVPFLVVGLSGQIGSGVSFVRDKLIQSITTYGYEAIVIDVTDVILGEAFSRYVEDELSDIPDRDNPVERVREYQNRGNSLREKYGPTAVASLALTDIIYEHLLQQDSDIKVGLERRTVFVIDSLKHPEEVRFLRNVFGDSFYAVGVVSSDATRRDRLCNRKGFTAEQFDELSRRDANEEAKSGQHAVEAIVEADYFFANESAKKSDISDEAHRFLRLVFQLEVETPRVDEVGMNLAASASYRSGCLSRQVGAAIITAEGELIATGRNDVPQSGGGLYSAESDQDCRCWTYTAKCSSNDHQSRMIDELADGILKIISDANGKTLDVSRHGNTEPASLEELKEALLAQVRERLRGSRISSLIEFSRAIHAEMDAIVSIARNGWQGLVGSTLYCTTYPCHNCAKHIIDAGIAKVIYLEPYEKSLARELHPDSIADPLQKREPGKVPFDVFGGVAPRKFDRFFEAGRPRKDKATGEYLDRDRERKSLPPLGAQCAVALEARIKKVVESHGIKPTIEDERETP